MQNFNLDEIRNFTINGTDYYVLRHKEELKAKIDVSFTVKNPADALLPKIYLFNGKQEEGKQEEVDISITLDEWSKLIVTVTNQGLFYADNGKESKRTAEYRYHSFNGVIKEVLKQGT